MIVSAAVKLILDDYAGTEVCIPVHRHKDGKIIGEKLLGYKPLIKEEGFLTEKGKFLGRFDALCEAVECGQLSDLSDEQFEIIVASNELMSEDLW